tara:strand:+ start:26728 stop:28344 length:1617 start_codon:yes stop_codon:yes gene_type:complete
MNKLFYSVTALIMSAVTVVCAQTEVQTGASIAVTSTTKGKVRGYLENGIYTYKGIPYAHAKRFESAMPLEAWKGVKSTTTYGPVAYLMNPTTTVQDESEFVFDHNWGYASEDNLRINVWTPGIEDSKKRAVLFWIHGGGFTSGSSQELPSYDGRNLAEKGDVVVVSINHRLNVLGFLNLSEYGEKYKHSANNSMRDIIEALKWVQSNIENFGGDPNNVTIFGQSGGGAKVNTLMAMPSANGLFHKAVNQSGSYRSRFLSKEVTQSITKETLKILKIRTKNIDLIQDVPFSVLSNASQQALKVVAERLAKEGRALGGFGLNWGPSLDGDLIPYDMSSNEAYEMSKNIPLLIGTTKNEFATFANGRFFGASEEVVMKYIEETFKDKATSYVSAVRKAYPKDTYPHELLTVDTMFRPGTVFQANKKASIEGGAEIYMYLFTWQSPVFDGKYQSVHCMELPFVFDNIELARNMTGGGIQAHALADRVSKAWISFAKNGDPNHDGLPDWPAYNPKNTATMHFDLNCEVKSQLDKELFKLVLSF